jgi:hypothetical protein
VTTAVCVVANQLPARCRATVLADNNHTWEVMKGASDGCPGNQPCRTTPAPYTDWFLQSEKTPVYSMSACEQMGLGYSHPPTDKCWNPIWNVANPDVRDFYIDKVIAPLAAAENIDGVFFDCFNFAYDLPNPWNRNAVNIPNCTHAKGGAGCDALLDGAVEMAARTAKALNKGGKVPMFSNPASFINGPKPAPIWLNESKLVDALDGTTWQLNYEFMRAEGLSSTGQLENMLTESKLGLAAGVHVYYQHTNTTDPTSPLEDPTPHIAAFMLMRQEHWYFFGSTGWLDADWKWTELYETLSKCGAPVDKEAVAGDSSGSVFTRKYAKCTAKVDCTDKAACKASITGPNGARLSASPRRQSATVTTV